VSRRRCRRRRDHRRDPAGRAAGEDAKVRAERGLASRNQGRRAGRGGIRRAAG